MNEEPLTCFVVMPFGVKRDHKGRKIDFDRVYKEIISPALAKIEILEVVRADDVTKSGWVAEDMYLRLVEADIVIADITTLNPNVMYELGVRHTARHQTTIILASMNTPIPFDLQGFRHVEYDPEKIRKDIASFAKRISCYIDEGLRNPSHSDSPVFTSVPNHNVVYKDQKYTSREIWEYRIAETPKKIGIVTGDLLGVRDIANVWVNPENLEMEMARPCDSSISSLIRYYGSKRDAAHQIVEDVIENDLRRVMRELNLRSVNPCAALLTTSGELKESHGVAMICHVASARGIGPGKGYSPVDDLEGCVINSLRTIERGWNSDVPVRVLMPLLGTGTAKGHKLEKVPRLISATLRYLQEDEHSVIQSVYFLGWSKSDVGVIKWALTKHADARRVDPGIVVGPGADTPGNVLKYRGDWISIEADAQGLEFVRMADEALVVALTDDNHVILVSEPTPLSNQKIMTLPGGSLSTGEDPAECARREMNEEIGFDATEFVFLGVVSPFSKYLTTRSFVFLARGLLPVKAVGDEPYEITTRQISLDSFRNHTISKDVSDCRTLAGLHMAIKHLESEGSTKPSANYAAWAKS